ncbi:MAG: glycosyltransferase family 2 protein [Cyanobacteria bacterium P01_D01_bin.50]
MAQLLPKISIVTPSYNQCEFIEETINSILTQNYPNLEYIIIDGGSTDGSVEIIKKYEKYLHFWCSESDAGQYDAINKGFAHSSGEIMAWLNSDDMYCPWAFKTVASIMSEFPEIEWLTTLNPGLWDCNGFCMGFGSIPGYSREAFLDGCHLPKNRSGIGWIQQESTFWRRSLWQKVNNQICMDFKMAGDFDLWARFFQHTDLYGTEAPLSGFRLQANQKSQQFEKYLLDAQKSLSNTRKVLNWRSNILRDIPRKLKLNKIPKIKDLVLSNSGYTCKRVVRKNPEFKDAFWEIEENKFYF